MNELLWIDSFARRLTELEAVMSGPTALRIADRMWANNQPVGGHIDPELAAEVWHRGFSAMPVIAS